MSSKLPASLEQLITGRGLSPDEVLFAEPWEARAFAMALALVERGRLRWADFQRRLIKQIAAAEPRQGAAGGNYYACWMAALEAELAADALVTPEEIERRAEAIAANPPAPTRAGTSAPLRIA